MAIFYNQANLSYSGGSTNSNIVSGEIIEVLSVTKTAVVDEYGAGDTLTYVVSIVNTGNAPYNNLSVRDDLGAYSVGELTVVPLDYVEGSATYYVNGVLQGTPAVVAGPPLVISGITVPAGGNAIIIYSARVNEFAPPTPDGQIVNTVTVSGGGISTPITATETVTVREDPMLTITKGLNPSVITENSELTYTFTIQNIGNTAAVATDDIVVTDNFDPVLSDITVLLDGVELTEGTQYTYNEATGEFATVPGVITVPAGSFVQDPVSGEWAVNPGSTVLVVRGTV